MCAGWEKPLGTDKTESEDANSVVDEADDLTWLDEM